MSSDYVQTNLTKSCSEHRWENKTDLLSLKCNQIEVNNSKFSKFRRSKMFSGTQTASPDLLSFMESAFQFTRRTTTVCHSPTDSCYFLSFSSPTVFLCLFLCVCPRPHRFKAHYSPTISSSPVTQMFLYLAAIIFSKVQGKVSKFDKRQSVMFDWVSVRRDFLVSAAATELGLTLQKLLKTFWFQTYFGG